MNDQNGLNNQFNNQFNNQPMNNGDSMPLGHTKKKFFSNAFMSDNSGTMVSASEATASNNSNTSSWEAIRQPAPNTVEAATTEVAQPASTGTFFNMQNMQTQNTATIPITDTQATPVVTTTEPETLDTLDYNQNIESLDDFSSSQVANNSLVQVPQIDQGISAVQQPTMMQPGVVQPGVVQPVVTQTTVIPTVVQPTVPVVGTTAYNTQVLPQDGSLAMGYNTQQVQMNNTMQVPVYNQGVVPQTGVPTIEQSAIFQATQQVQMPQQQVQPQIETLVETPAQPWMAAQPLSQEVLEEPDVLEEPVMSANQREALIKKQQEEAQKANMPVPAEVVKPKEEVKVREDLLAKEFGGEDYTSIVMSPFSFGGFIFGAAAFAYRKMIITSIIALAASLGILFFVPINYNYLGVLGLHIFDALIINRLFVIKANMVAKQTRKRNNKRSEPMSQERLQVVVRNKGKRSPINGILVICLFLASIIFISIKVLPNRDFSKIIRKAFEGQTTAKKQSEYKFDGTIKYDGNYDIGNLIKYTVPEGFESTGEKYLSYKLVTDGNGVFNECSFKIASIEDFDNGNTYVIKIAEFDEGVDKIKTSKAKGIDWTNYTTMDATSTIYYRGTTINDKSLLFEYRIGNDSNKETCDIKLIELLNSIELKED